LTPQGHPRTIYKRAIERGNVMLAETTARELRLSLEEALQLVFLYAAHEPAKVERAAVRWLARYVDEHAPGLLQVLIAAAALAELRSDHGDAAGRILLGLL